MSIGEENIISVFHNKYLPYKLTIILHSCALQFYVARLISVFCIAKHLVLKNGGWCCPGGDWDSWWGDQLSHSVVTAAGQSAWGQKPSMDIRLLSQYFNTLTTRNIVCMEVSIVSSSA